MDQIKAPARHPRLCRAHSHSKRSKQLCVKWAMKAQQVCSFHGGKAKRALANAQRAIERADLQLRGLTVPAVDALKQLLHADSESVILGAAKDILDRGGLKAAGRRDHRDTSVVNLTFRSPRDRCVHRIGRVGRAGREGIAITLAEPRQRRLLKNIEKLTRQTIDVRTVPSVADLRARQVESTVAAIREALAADDLEDFSAVLHDLANEASDRTVALAAVKLVHEGRGAVLDEVEIPDASARVAPLGKSRRGDRDGPGGRRPGRPGHEPSGGPGPRNRRSGSRPGFVHVGLGSKAGPFCLGVQALWRVTTETALAQTIPSPPYGPRL